MKSILEGVLGLEPLARLPSPAHGESRAVANCGHRVQRTGPTSNYCRYFRQQVTYESLNVGHHARAEVLTQGLRRPLKRHGGFTRPSFLSR